MKLKVSYESTTKKKCVACSGSGYYDAAVNGRIPKCASCNGTGVDSDQSK